MTQFCFLCYSFHMIKEGLSGSSLKLLACLFMLLDHIMKLFEVEIFYSLGPVFFYIFSPFGTLSFFIFAYFIAEGLRYTHSKSKYLIRLLLFALISEVPFRFFKGLITATAPFVSFGSENVIFTLLYGALACILYDYFVSREKKRFALVSVIIIMLLSVILKSDYSLYGVLAIFLVYIAKDKRSALLYLSLVILYTYLSLFISQLVSYGYSSYLIFTSGSKVIISQLTIPLLYLYNGERGRGLKYFFYIFYPLHMALLVSIYLLI